MKIIVEVTDTFNGEANYAWLKRYEMEVPATLSNYAIVRRAKRHIGWSGKRTSTVGYADYIELRPYGECTVCFITWSN